MIIQTPVFDVVNVHYEWTGPLGSTSTAAYTDDPIIVIDEATADNQGAYNNGIRCANVGDNVTHSATATGGSGDYSFHWTGLNGFTSTSDITSIPNVDEGDSVAKR